MTTENVIQEIAWQLISKNRSYAILQPYSLYQLENIDWQMVKVFFNTEMLHPLPHTDRIMIIV